MAEEIALDIKIQTAESAKTVQELKKSLKELKNELNNVEAGSAQFNKLTHSINNTEGKLGDLNDSFQTLTGSGVERATKSFGLLKEGFLKFDFDKIKIGFKGLGAAMSALPMFLIAEGVQLLIENFDVVVDVFKSFIGVSKEAEIQAKRLTSALEGQAKAVQDLSRISDDYTKQEILNAKLRGASEEESQKIAEQGFKRKIQYQKEYLDEATKTYNALLRNESATVEQVQKAGDAQLEAQQGLKKLERDFATFKLQTHVDTNEKIKAEDKKSEEDYKKHLDEKAKLNKEHEDELLRQHQAEVAKFERARKDEAEREKQAKIDEVNALNQAAAEANDEFENDEWEKDKKRKSDKEFADLMANERALENEKAFKKQSVAVTIQALQATQALTDLYFAHQLRQAKGNAEREKEIKKKQFQLNKAFAVAQIVLNTIQSITQAIGSNPPPLSWVLAGINSAMGTAATIAALAQKFDDGGGATNVGSIGDMGGGGATASAPAIAQPNNSVTKISDEGKVIDKPMNQRVFVLETDITDSTKKITSIEESAKIH